LIKPLRLSKRLKKGVIPRPNNPGLSSGKVNKKEKFTVAVVIIGVLNLLFYVVYGEESKLWR